MDAIKSKRRMPKHKIIRIKEFVSPIDKLLKKNSSISDSVHTLPLKDNEKIEKFHNKVPIKEKTQNEAEANEQNNAIVAKLKQLEKGETKANQTSEEAYTNEREVNVEVVSEEEVQSNNGGTTDLAEMQNETQLYTNGTLRKINFDQTQSAEEKKVSVTEKAQISKIISCLRDSEEKNSMALKLTLENLQQNKTSDHLNKRNDWEMQNWTTIEQERKMADESTKTIELKTEFIDTEGNDEFNEEISSTKSPSAVSMDSAIGSSIVTESYWKALAVGDLLWGQIYNYCYWPCMVCPDPDGKTISAKDATSIGDQHIMVHVRFFADKGRRNWVKLANLMPYTTLTSYQELLDDYREKYGTKSAKFKQLVPKKTKVSLWRVAVREMEKVATVAQDKRLDAFFEIFEKTQAVQKQERHRRKSLNLDIRNGHHMANSDAESYYGSTDITNNLTASSGNIKRGRSISPFCPAVSTVTSISGKKRKVSEDNMEQLLTSDNNISIDAKIPQKSQSADLSSKLNVLDIYQGTDFESFHAAIKEFVLEGNQNEILEQSLCVAVRNIWALKELSREQMKLMLRTSEINVDEKCDNNANTFESVGADEQLSIPFKRFSTRKSLSMQRLSPSLVDLSGETAAVAATAKTEEDAPLNAAEKSKRGQIVNRPILEVIDDIFELDNRYLFKGMSRDPVCKYCLRPGGNLKKCSMNCSNWLHIDHKANSIAKRNSKRLKTVSGVSALITEEASTCSAPVLYDTSDTAMLDEDVICKECANHEPAKCEVCNLTDSMQPDDPLVKCHMTQCDRAFHPACSKNWPQSKITISKNHIQSFRCPSHVCHTCVSDDPKGKFQYITNAKITKCVQCPATYHTDSTCIPAGSQILTSAHIICPRHSSLKTDMTVNVNWCFICVGGGQVVCCETCPTAVHAQCLKVPIDPNQGYICEECESGRMPLYGEIVWAKFNNFRWWPAIILPPTEIPKNIARKSHNPSDFVVRFFGTHDHGWISRRRVYIYLEGDSSQPPKTKSSLDQNYLRGVMEAKEMYEIIKAKMLKHRNAKESKEKVHPQPYVRIKVNRAVPPVKLHVDIESVSKCECDPKDANPCGPESSCLNRVLYHECNPKVCPAGKRCQNQMFESRISPRMDVVYVKERGFGLVSRESIPAGSFVIEYVGEVINDGEFKTRMSQKSSDRDENFYFLSVEKDYIIDAGSKGNLARFMNHSCDPNCETQKWSVNSLNRVGLFAIKDIPENTELTFNYHWDDLLGNEKTTCYCGAIKCAGHIGGKIKDGSKEPSPISDSLLNSKAKSGTKSKLKPLKRSTSTPSEAKRKPKRQTVERKSSKMLAAAALAAKLGNDGNDNVSSPVSISQSLEEVFC